MSESALKQQIFTAMKDAMRAKDKARLGVIRLALADIKRIEVDERIDPDNERIISILDKMLKQRRESIRQYLAGNRQDLADQESFEIGILQEFLPSALDEAEITAIVKTAISETAASNIRDMGKVMKLVRPQLVGRADMATVSQLIKNLLG